MLPSVYLDSNVFGYVAARPFGDPIVAEHQRITQDWWKIAPQHYTLVTSEVVFAEIARGDPNAARQRIALLEGIVLLKSSTKTQKLAKSLVHVGVIPPKAIDDASHIAIAAINQIDYLATWNLRHIANETKLPEIRRVLAAWDYHAPKICTPATLMEVLHERRGL